MERWELERLEPHQGRGERIPLDPARGEYTIGRARHSTLRLFSASASREHALLRWDPERPVEEGVAGPMGAWVLTPLPGKPILADGDPLAEACTLCQGLTLAFGRDRLRVHCLEMTEPVRAPALAGEGARPAPSRRVVVGLVALLAVLLLGLGVAVLVRISE